MPTSLQLGVHSCATSQAQLISICQYFLLYVYNNANAIVWLRVHACVRACVRVYATLYSGRVKE